MNRRLFWISVVVVAGVRAGVDLAPRVGVGIAAAGAVGWAIGWARGRARASAEAGAKARAEAEPEANANTPSPLRAALLSLCLCLGLLRGASAPRPADDPRLFASVDDPASVLGGREPLALEGEVRETHPARGGARLVVRVERREPRPGGPIERAPGGLRIEVHGPRWLHRGDRIRGFARLGRPLAPLQDGDRDPRSGLRARAIALVGTLAEPGLEVLARGPWLFRAVDEARDRFLARCLAVGSTPARGAMIAALGTGDRSALPVQVADELSESGLVHLVASAGLHLWALGLLVGWPMLWVSLRLPWLGRRHARAAAAGVALPALGVATLLLGAPWAAVRAWSGISLRLGGALVRRRADALTSLGASVALCALWEPGATHDLGLWLAALGVLGLIVLAPRVRELVPVARPAPSRRLRLLLRLREVVVSGACAALAAGLCTAPLVVWAFGRVSIVALLANAVGLVPGLAALPLAALALPLDALQQTLALPLFWLADGLAGAVLWLSHAAAALPGAQLRMAPWGGLELAAWAAAVGLLSGVPGPLGTRPHPARARPRVRVLRALVPLSLLGLLAGGRSLAQAPPAGLSLAFLAVGQGDSTLVRFPDGFTMLVDAGGDLRGLPEPLGPGLVDVGKRTVLPALTALGVRRLDLAVLTHPHPDHAGGFPSVFEELEVGELWVTGEPGPGDLGGRLRALAEARGVRVRTPRPGERLSRGAASVEVLAPVPVWDPARSTNDNSLVLRVRLGDVAVLLAGDAEALEEAQLAAGDVRARVLKAGHHGSRTSSTEAFLRAVGAEEVVISCGRMNPFGFPHAEVLARVRDAGARAWRTDQGQVRAWTDGQALRVEQEAPR